MSKSTTVPYVFIGSSAEKLKVAESLQVQLGNRKVLTRNWGQNGVFKYGSSNLDNLISMANDVDYACFIVDDDDIKISRGQEFSAMRDNVLFEIALFTGTLGKDNVFVICNRDNKPSFPSDYNGISTMEYQLLNHDLDGSLGVTAIEIRNIIDSHTNILEDVACNADWLIAHKEATTLSKVEIKPTTDTSDLFFLFLNVEDCSKSRIIINRVVTELEDDYHIEAIYDLLGTWDILIKYRTSQDAYAFQKEVLKQLIDNNQMNSDITEKFSGYILEDVKRQSLNIGGLISPNKNEKIFYSILKNTDDYAKYRASRAFVYLEAEDTFGSKRRKAFLNELKNELAKSKGKTIIESFCETDNALIIETFSSCSQTTFVNHLNKSVENVIQTYRTDKTNLICYEYNEQGLLNLITKS